MILTAIILSPMLIAMGLMIQFHIRKKRWIPLVTIPTLIFIFIFQCVIMTLKWHLGMELSSGLMEARAWIMSIIFPLVYIFICSKSGEDWFSVHTVTLLGFGLLNISNGMTLYFDDVITEPMPVDDNLYIMLKGKPVVAMGMQEVVLIMQMLWILVRGISMYNNAKRQNLHLSKKSIVLLKTIAISFVIAFISTFVPNRIWEQSLLFPWVFIVPISMCFTYAELLVSWGYALTPILDKNDEPAIDTVSINDDLLKKDIQKLIEGEKLYLDSDLRIETVSMRLNTNRNYVSKTINEQFGCNFTTYINRLRIRDAEALLKEDPTINLESLAAKCGFNSAGSFTKVFKKETGMNPSRMKKSLSGDLQ